MLAATICRADSMLPVKSIGAQSPNDSVNWSQLGADATSLGSSFNVTSDGGLSVTATLSGSGSLVSVACPASPCSWNGTGFNADDSLVWTSGPDKSANGPLNLELGSPVSGIGAFIEADGPAQFTAQVQVFNGTTSLGSFPVTSNTNGDATYIGVIDQTGANISSAVFSITTCNGACADFAIDTINLNDRTVASPTPTGTGSPAATPTATPTSTQTPTATPTPGGRIRVKQKSVTLFAKVDHHASANVKVINHGTGMLVGSISGPAGSPFSSTGTGPFAFSPGGAESIKITFSPTIKGKFKAVLTITSDDPRHPSVSVPITGKATGTAGADVTSPGSSASADSATDAAGLTDATIASATPASEAAAAAPTSTKTDASAATVAGAGWYIPIIPPFGGPTFNIGPWATLGDCNDMDGSFMYKHPIACHRTGLPADCGIIGNGAGYPNDTPYPPLAENDPTTRIMGGCFWSSDGAPRAAGVWYFLEYHALPTPGGSAQACANFKHFKALMKKDPAHYKVATVRHGCGGPCWPIGIDNACE